MRVIKLQGTIKQVINQLNELTQQAKQDKQNPTLLDLYNLTQRSNKQC